MPWCIDELHCLAQLISSSQQFVFYVSICTPCFLMQVFQIGTALGNVLRSLFLCATLHVPWCYTHQTHSFHVLVEVAVVCPCAEYDRLFSPFEAVNVAMVRALTSIFTFTVCSGTAFNNVLASMKEGLVKSKRPHLCQSTCVNSSCAYEYH